VSLSPYEHSDCLRIGIVDFVSPSEIKVALDIETPDSMALNAGGPRSFPRVNSYVLIPVDDAFLVGQIGWLTVERSAFPKRQGMQDFGLVDLPYPLRKLSLNPLGTLRKKTATKAGDPDRYIFRRGADALPSVGENVLLPTDTQLRSIVESGEGGRVKIGTSPLAGDAEVKIDPNRLFGRHLAVLGNTGSGKSCSIAGLIRWSLEATQKARESDEEIEPKIPNARFIILDPNGEYSRAFYECNDIKTRIFKINPKKDSEEIQLNVPCWFWNSTEWCSFTQATSKTQKPLLIRALREVKAGRVKIEESTEEEQKLSLRKYLSSTLITLQRNLRSGNIKTGSHKFGHILDAYKKDIESKNILFQNHHLHEIFISIDIALQATFYKFNDRETGKSVISYRPFTEEQIEAIITNIKKSLETLGGIIYQEGPDEDIPLFFKGSDLADHLEILAIQENASQYLDFLITRIRILLSDSRMNDIIGCENEVVLEDWLSNIIGLEKAENGCVSIIDLSLVPTEVVHVVTAVIARMIFEALQRHMKANGVALPTVLVMEEAHTFIKRYKYDIDNQDAAMVCCEVFERIAREGRKFGLGLVLSSQRPSELSPTVLSQCNTFLLHRITNDRDQELVHKLVPDNLKGLLRDLPLLPSQSAILLGWATELPVIVKMNDLPKHHQPQSDDSDFWGAWTGKDADNKEVSCAINWKPIADEWQGQPNTMDLGDDA
jgi:hypothetical protein